MKKHLNNAFLALLMATGFVAPAVAMNKQNQSKKATKCLVCERPFERNRSDLCPDCFVVHCAQCKKKQNPSGKSLERMRAFAKRKIVPDYTPYHIITEFNMKRCQDDNNWYYHGFLCDTCYQKNKAPKGSQ